MKMEEYNAIFGQQQIENIHYTLSLIETPHKSDRTDNLVKKMFKNQFNGVRSSTSIQII